MARGGTLNLVGAACNQLCLFAVVTLVARYLGGEAVGEYTLGWAFLIVVGLVALWGFQAALIRFVSIHLTEQDPARVRGTIRLGVLAPVVLSLVLAALVAILAVPLAGVFNHPALATVLRLVALTLPAATLRDTSLAATQGWRSQRAFALIGWILEPTLRLAITALTIGLGWGLTAAFAAIPIAAWTAAILAVLSLRKRLRTVPPGRPLVNVREVLRFSTVSWGTVLASVGLVWADTLILGVLRTPEQVGVYNVSSRLVNLAVFVINPMYAALGPQFARLLHRQERRPLGHLYAASTRWILVLSLPAFVLLLVFARDLLRIFGNEYETGVSVTVILALGQLVNAGTGPCGALLNMSGRLRLNMLDNVAVLVLNIALNLLLIPPYGVTGAAVAWSVSLATVNLARVVQVWRIFGVLPFSRPTGKVLLAAAAAAGVGLVVRLLVADPGGRLVLGIVGGVLTYGLVLWLLGFEDEDREAARSIVRRRGADALTG